MPRPASRKPAPATRRRFALPPLTTFDGDALEPERDYDRLDLADLDLANADASDARFLESRIARCRLDGAVLRRVSIAESLLAEVHATTIDLTDSTWRDSEIAGGRLGAVTLAGATLSGVRVLGSKLGFVGLAGADLADVVFERCEIGSLDARGATLRSVSFVDCGLDELNVSGATLERVDLSGARLRLLVGVDRLRGAILGTQQLLDLAPLLAAELGIEVRPDAPDDAPGPPSEV